MIDDRVIHVDEMDLFPDAVYIGRQMTIRYPYRPLGGIASPMGMKRVYKRSRFANPYRIGEHLTREMALESYTELFYANIATVPGFIEALIDLRGKRLACWCRRSDQEITPETACHGDIILASLDINDDETLRSFWDPITAFAR